MSSQITQTVDAEIAGLSDEYVRGGIRALVETIDRRTRHPDSSLYLLTDFAGTAFAGNIAGFPTQILDESENGIRRVKYSRLGPDGSQEREALVRTFELRGGFRLLVGRDLGDETQFAQLLGSAMRLWLVVVVLMGGVTWVFVNRRVMKRIDGIADTSQTIMHGDLSGRLPVAGNNDEFDRLANNLNDMLERIELLMHGMKDVTDNIAHDLKTPLTRMRTRVETALHDGRNEAELRAALETTLEESDNLLRIFDALLRIARVEAMAPDAGMGPVDLSNLIEQVAELYEPVLEDEGGVLKRDVGPNVRAVCNGDLITQTLVNLIENALKYGRPKDGALQITLKAAIEGDRVYLSVADNGQGIPKAQTERVTGKFVRLDASRSEPGYGLGLSLVSAVVRLHGGHLLLQDAAPGLCARIDLKKAPDEQPAGEGRENGGQPEPKTPRT
nr:HAMP domain-containing sensor histidine kinase [Roseibium sp. RKSG952]